MSTNHPEPPRKRLVGAILRDAVSYLSASNTVEVLRGELSEMRRAWRPLLFLFIVFAGFIWYFVAVHYAFSHAEEERALAADYNRKVESRNKETATLRYELQTVRAERDKAQLELQPWKERAKREFPFDDVSSALAKLDAKTETIMAMFRSSIVHPLNEPINSATCTVSIEVVTDRIGTGSTDIGAGGYAALCVGDKPGLVASTTNHRLSPEGKIELVGEASVFDAFMGKPVSTILTAQYIQLGFHPRVIAKDTEVLRGVVVWVINNRISLKFEIPPQKAMPETNGEGSWVFVRFLAAGMAPLEALARQESAPADRTFNLSPDGLPPPPKRDPSK